MVDGSPMSAKQLGFTALIALVVVVGYDSYKAKAGAR